nr:diguanylate cyclase [Paenibacillus sp. Leaf72]
MRHFFGKLKHAENRAEASQVAAEEIRKIMDYNRVMVYEFDKEWNGKVIAESKDEGLESFFGHHYPASDIPKQARELYLRNWLRVIVDVAYDPVEIVPAVQPLTGKSLNLSLSVLSSVSPMHIEYLQNMGVGATMTISLIHDNQLWGLITCHHYSRKYISHWVRNLCNFLGSFFSSEWFQRQQLDEYEREARLRKWASHLASIFVGDNNPIRLMDQLKQEESNLLNLMSATGAAVCYQEKLLLLGETPTEAQVEQLAQWLAEQSLDHVYQTSSLSVVLDLAKSYKELASGVLYLALSPGHENFIMWFRPEQVQVVHWAGDPAKAVIQGDDGIRLSPRKSFEKWRQVVESTALSWSDQELRMLPELKSIVMRHTEEQLRQAQYLAMHNSAIVRKNEQRYIQLMEASSVPFFTLTNRAFVYANSQAARLLGEVAAKTLMGRPFMSFVHDSSQAEFEAQFQELVQDPLNITTVIGRINKSDGQMIVLEFMLVSVVYGGEISIMAIAREYQTDANMENVYSDMLTQLQSLTTTDPLTELPNRQAFYKELADDVREGAERGYSVALLMVDMDDLRIYNALQGFNVGDSCLQYIADLLSVMGRQGEVVAGRLEGGTFVLYKAKQAGKNRAVLEKCF